MNQPFIYSLVPCDPGEYYIENYDEDRLVYSSEEEDDNRDTKNSRIWKHTIVSMVAYLLGVSKENFENGQVFEKEIYDAFEKEKPARIVRNLCRLRTAIFKNGKKIYDAMSYDFKNLSTLPEYIPQDSLRQLYDDGISIEKVNYRLNYYSIDINENLKNRINNCKRLFPDWVNWDYIKELFIIPKGSTEAGIIAAAKAFGTDWNNYPFRMYINWPEEECGNILYHDGRFMQRLYSAHKDNFTDITKVRDASEETKTGIYEFLKDSQRTALIVDCENSDPYKLYAVLKNLNQQALLSKIVGIVLFDDFHTTDAWKIFNEFTEIPVQYKQIDRVKENKSLVDQTLMITATKMVYSNNIDSFILAASDSDYWALMQELPNTRFLVMMEYGKCGPDIKTAMENKGIMYCYIDDFCTGDISEIKNKILLKELRLGLNEAVSININTIIDNAIERTRMKLTQDERNAYYKRLIKDMRIDIDDNGELSITTGV